MVVVVVVVVGTAVTVMETVPVVAELYVLSEALVADTVHEPTDDVESTAPESEQPAEPADVNEYVTDPVPEPPDVLNVRLVPNIVAVAVNVSADCVSFDTVMVTVPVVADPYVPLAAFVALTVHVPDEVGVNTAPESEQPADPAETRAKVTEPEPEPPVVDNVKVAPTFIVLSAIDKVA